MVVGALGVAIVGSLISSLYAGRLYGAPAAARDSIGAAAHVPGLREASARAFTDAMGIGLSAGAVLAVLIAPLVLVRFAPRRLARPARSAS
jgi:hypothetical protein